MTIANDRLLRDGAAWIPHGYFQIAFEAGPDVPKHPFLATANAGYTPREYAEMAAAGADKVRMMISQPSADPAVDRPPGNPAYSAELVARFISAVQAARTVGLTVIVSIQDEKLAGGAVDAGLHVAEREGDAVAPADQRALPDRAARVAPSEERAGLVEAL